MLAMKGAEILDRAIFFASLEEATRSLDLILGTTGRLSPQARLLKSHNLSQEVVQRFPQSSIGIAFGPEGNGLERSELRLCEWLLEIPTAPAASSLNLAQAVAVVAYELHSSSLEQPAYSLLHHASREEVQRLLSHAECALSAVQLPAHVSLPRLMRRLSRIAGRAKLETEDVSLLRWLLSEVEKKSDP